MMQSTMTGGFKKLATVLAFSGSLIFGMAVANDDIVIDFGGIGLWARMNDASWLKLNNASPEQVVSGDLDGNGADDVIAVFSSGIFVKRNLGGWAKLHNFIPEALAVGDLDNNGKDDLVIDFGGIGLWARMNDSSWLKLNNASPAQVVTGDMDGNGADDVIAVFSSGIFVKRNLGGWVQLHNFIPETLAVGGLDNNNKDDLIVDFGAIGLWARMNDASWLKLHNSSPELIASGDLDGNGSDDVIATFTGSGLWQKLNLGGWSQLNAISPDEVVTGDVDGSGKDDVIAKFGSTIGGIFVKRNQGPWTKLHNTSPDSMTSGNLDGGSQGTLDASLASTVTTLAGVLDKGTIIAVNSAGRIVSTFSTASKTPNVDRNNDNIPESFTFTLGSVPVAESVRTYAVRGGAILPVFFDSDNNGSVDTNVFSIDQEVSVDIGFVDTSAFEFSPQAVTEPRAIASPAVSYGAPIAPVPVGINSPPTGGLSLAELNQEGLGALAAGWATGARSYFAAATVAAGNSTSQEADTARFFSALSRVAALAFDTMSDGNAQDMNRFGDILDLFGFIDDATRTNPDLIDQPDPLDNDSPDGNELRDFLYQLATPELESAVQELGAVSPAFVRQWFEPFRDETVESDYGDALFFKGAYQLMLAAIATQRAYDLGADIDSTVNANRDADPFNDVSTNAFLTTNSSFLSLADTSKLAEAKNRLTGGAFDDLDAALVQMAAETDSQLDDLVTLDDVARDGLDTARDFLADAERSVTAGPATIDFNDLDPDNDINVDTGRFYDTGVDFRTPNRLPLFSGKDLDLQGTNPCFPDPAFNQVLFLPDLNEDLNLNGLCDIAE